MRRGRLGLAIAAVCAFALALGLGLGSGGAASASPASRAATTAVTSPSSPSPVVINCEGHSQVRPAALTLACADGNNGLTGLTWTSWTPKLASGYGTQAQNDCTPNCATGHFHRYPVLVVLWGAAGLSGHPGLQRYTKITLIYTGARPQVYNGHRWVEGPATVTTSLAA
jgi:hypothetical protein